MALLATALRSFAGALALVLLLAGTARATTFVIDNGSAPPDPANVIGAVTPDDGYEVRDSPGGASTAVEVVDPAEFYWLQLYDASSASILGGTGTIVSAGDQSSIVMSGGTFNFIFLGGGASLVLDGGGNGTLADSGLETYGDASATILGGQVSDNGLSVYDRSQVTIRGGSFVSLGSGPEPGHLGVYDEGVVRVYGTGFAIDGIPVPLGPVTGGGRLTGILESGEPLDVGFGVSSSAVLLLVPEPAPALLLASGLGGLGGLAAARARGRARV
ncbi:MAG: hypothetical protein OZ948_07385 [Deltaproteobacteria bacterium]|nr:hypothetical protein [Deltaproteobacteria bacterium]